MLPNNEDIGETADSIADAVTTKSAVFPITDISNVAPGFRN